MATPLVTIRKATSDDIEKLLMLRAYLIDRVADVSYASRNASESNAWKVAYRTWLPQAMMERRDIHVIVADCAGEPVACAIGIIDRRPPAPDCPSGSCGWIQTLVVSPSWRRKGIAGRLLRALLEWFASQEVKKVALETTADGENLYIGNGFARSEEHLMRYIGGRI